MQQKLQRTIYRENNDEMSHFLSPANTKNSELPYNSQKYDFSLSVTNFKIGPLAIVHQWPINNVFLKIALNSRLIYDIPMEIQ